MKKDEQLKERKDLQKAVDRVDRTKIIINAVGIGIIIFFIFWLYEVMNGVALDIWLWRLDDIIFDHHWNLVHLAAGAVIIDFFRGRITHITMSATDRRKEARRRVRKVHRRETDIIFELPGHTYVGAPYWVVSKEKSRNNYTIATPEGSEYYRVQDEEFGEVLMLETEFELIKEQRYKDEIQYLKDQLAKARAENLQLTMEDITKQHWRNGKDEREPAKPAGAA